MKLITTGLSESIRPLIPIGFGLLKPDNAEVDEWLFRHVQKNDKLKNKGIKKNE